MRIAYVCTDAGIPVFGCKGASVHVQGIVRAMARAGHEVTLLAARLGGEAPDWAHGIALHHVRLPTPTTGPATTEANAPLVRALDATGPHDLVYERYSLWSFGGMEFAEQRGIPGVLEVNAPLIDEAVTHRGLADRAEAERVACRTFRAASTIVAVSREVADWVDASPCAGARALVEPNGVEPDRFRAHRPPPGAPFTIGFVGTLKPWHGLEGLADAFALVRQARPDARLLIVGDGPARDAFCARLATHGVLHATEFTGAVPPDAVDNLLGRMHVAVAPYPPTGPFYFSPLKVVEYQAAGVPVVASDIGQIRQLVRHRETGWLVPPGDARACADACLAIAAHPGQAALMANVARAHVLAERSWDAVLERILGHVRRLPARSRSRPHVAALAGEALQI